jgi:hypothetical protein
MPGQMTQEQAQGLWDELCVRKHPASLSFRYHERLMPAETYSVTISLGPGRFTAAQLADIMEAAEKHGTEVHIIGDSLLFLPG